MTIVTVVETPEFQRRARDLLPEADRLALIDFVARNPMTGCLDRGRRAQVPVCPGGRWEERRLPRHPFLQRG